MDIYEEIVRLKKEGRSCALAMIVQCAGSSPQKEGAKMLVRDDGSIVGTMGGGCLEAEVIQASVMTIRDGATRTIPFELTERHGGLVCGGKVLVYIEPILPEPRLIILGAGHVGRALTKVAKFSGFRTTIVDDREEHAKRSIGFRIPAPRKRPSSGSPHPPVFESKTQGDRPLGLSSLQPTSRLDDHD